MSLWFVMKVDRALLAVSLFFLGVTLFLTGLSFRMDDFTLRVQTMIYATYMFLSGIAILVSIEIIHLAKREMAQQQGP